jgi:hypothetical protein
VLMEWIILVEHIKWALTNFAFDVYGETEAEVASKVLSTSSVLGQ